MKTIKNLTIAALIVLGLAAVVLGPQKVRSHMEAGRERISAGVDEVSSDAQEAAHIQVVLRDFDEDVLEYQDKLADVESQLVEGRRTVQRLETEIGNQREILAKEREMLKQENPSYQI